MLDGKIYSVLEYSENIAGWSEELTRLHEETTADEHPIDVASRKNAIEQIKKLSPKPEDLILEVGCSSGFLIKELKENFPQTIVLGADVVKDALHRLAHKSPGTPLFLFDLTQCPLPEASMDIVVALNVLEHIEDDVLALKKIYHLLKPGGKLIIEVPASPWLYDSFDAALHHFRRYTAKDLIKKMQSAGFVVTHWSHLGFFAYPAFLLVKLVSKYIKPYTDKARVKKQIAHSANSKLLNLSLQFEGVRLNHFSLPFGIRIVAVGSKK